MGTAVALRRKVPEKMLLLVIAMGLAQLALNVQPQIQDFAMLVIVYTVASAGERWASRVALVGGCARRRSRMCGG